VRFDWPALGRSKKQSTKTSAPRPVRGVRVVRGSL